MMGSHNFGPPQIAVAHVGDVLVQSTAIERCVFCGVPRTANGASPQIPCFRTYEVYRGRNYPIRMF